jgi:hypothetical protein
MPTKIGKSTPSCIQHSNTRDPPVQLGFDAGELGNAWYTWVVNRTKRRRKYEQGNIARVKGVKWVLG